MLDMTPFPDTTVPGWQRTLQRGDIVSFVFPCSEDDPTEPPKARPCLVLELEDRAGQRFAQLAYGTTSMSGRNKGYEVRVMQREDHLSCGLHEPTRFICARTVAVSVDHPAFRRAPDRGTPLIGRLTEPLLDRMNAVRGRLHAEADIAAERRRERSTFPRKGGLQRGRDFTVECRKPRRRRAAVIGSVSGGARV
ncbi:MAG: hypothetical protein V2I43_16375 [Parvularcula sp.]|nr:hypothetical protein [Parvularcula sp.]